MDLFIFFQENWEYQKWKCTPMSVDDTYTCTQDWLVRQSSWLLGNEDEDDTGTEKHERWANQKYNQLSEWVIQNADWTNIIKNTTQKKRSRLMEWNDKNKPQACTVHLILNSHQLALLIRSEHWCKHTFTFMSNNHIYQ